MKILTEHVLNNEKDVDEKFLVDLSGACLGYVWGMFWGYSGYVLGMFWGCFGYVSGMFWVFWGL